MTALQIVLSKRLCEPFFDLLFPCCFVMLVVLKNIRVLAWVPVGAVSAVFFNQVGALTEPRVVFRVVPAGLGDIFAEGKKHLVADGFGVVNLRSLRHGLVDPWVRVLSVPSIVEVPRLMIDTCTQ